LFGTTAQISQMWNVSATFTMGDNSVGNGFCYYSNSQLKL